MPTKLKSTGVEFPDNTTQTTEGVTSVSAGNALTGGGSGSSITINHADTSSQGSVSNSDSDVIQSVTLDDFGHVTSLSSVTINEYSDSDALSLFNATGSAPVYACRAWVNFDGTGTVSIRDSGNVSSITDNGAGDYTVNFATAMPDNDYCLAGSPEETDGNGGRESFGARDFASGSVRIQVGIPTGFVDLNTVSVAIFR